MNLDDDYWDSEHVVEAAREAFFLGVQMCREMMARFVEQGGDAVTAGSIRANWNPAWGPDPGRPDDADYERVRAAEDPESFIL